MSSAADKLKLAALQVAGVPDGTDRVWHPRLETGHPAVALACASGTPMNPGSSNRCAASTSCMLSTFLIRIFRNATIDPSILVLHFVSVNSIREFGNFHSLTGTSSINCPCYCQTFHPTSFEFHQNLLFITEQSHQSFAEILPKFTRIIIDQIVQYRIDHHYDQHIQFTVLARCHLKPSRHVCVDWQ